MMIFHTTFVITTLAGKPVTWNAQDRGDRGIGFLEALNRHKWQILLGLGWGAAILLMAPRYIWWMMPILSGLVLSVPLTMLTSLASAGKWMRKHGLLLTPEETYTPPELASLEEKLATGVTAVVSDKGINVAISAPPIAPPAPAVTFAPLTAASGGTTLVTATSAAIAANDESIGGSHEEDIIGILSIANLPARKPLQMEAATPVYLRPRDALTGLGRLLSGAWTA
jgi:membrane glycosyltransferase